MRYVLGFLTVTAWWWAFTIPKVMDMHTAYVFAILTVAASISSLKNSGGK